jgi:MATE family multidrug resistance protein
MVVALDDAPPLSKLTKYPYGSLREVVFLSLPIMLVLLSGSLFGFTERIILAKYSLDAMEGLVSVLYLCRLFQLPCMGVALFGQAFVASYVGAKQFDRIGGCIWQLIWFSFLSLAVTLPMSWIVGPIFFEGTPVEEAGLKYFYLLAIVNFLYPLGSALSSFYLGRGKATYIVATTLIAHILNLLLDVIFVLGIKDFIPPLGIQGAAIATILVQGIFCAILFVLFMKKSHRDLYGIANWKFKPLECWSYIKVGLSRAVGKIIMLGIGTVTIHVMTAKGGTHLMVLSIGASIVVFFSFIGDGIYQAMLTLVSHLIGSNQFHLRYKLLNAAFRFLVILALILMFPLLLFPDFLLGFFFPEPLQGELRQTLHTTLHWVWFHMMGYISVSIFLGFILSLKDSFYYLIVVSLTTFTSLIPIYMAINHWNWSPDKFWAITGVEGLLLSLLYFVRLLHPKWNTFSLTAVPRIEGFK